MRNRALYGALRDFALESAALLTDDLRAGAEVEFDVIDQAGRRGPALYQYKPRTQAFLGERWARLRKLDTHARAATELGSGAALWLRVNGGAANLSGEQAEPALRAMLERLYEDSTSFGFPEERFERVYREVEGTLYRDGWPLASWRHCVEWRSRRSASTSATACRSCAGRPPTRPPRRSGPRTAMASRRCCVSSSAT